MLWLGIHLPWLPLTVFERGNASEAPLAVASGRDVVQANTVAVRNGVTPGMRLAGAQALIADLLVRERDMDAEARLLQRLAGWALQYSDTISPEPPNELMLEIGGSLRYFGGLERLRRRLKRSLAELGHSARLGIAPTPTAAILRARAARESPVLTAAELEEALGELPTDVLSLTARQRKALDALGMEHLGDCLALPRAGLSRRLGQSLIDTLDRALGRQPDPRSRWQPPAAYTDRLDLLSEVANSDDLIAGFEQLIQGLAAFLRGSEAATQQIAFRLIHQQQSPTPFNLGLATASRDSEHLFGLLRERLDRIRLPAPVTALELACHDIRHRPPDDRRLFEPERGKQGDDGLINRLIARLGEQCIQGLVTQPDHRPERAWAYQATGQENQALNLPPRPLWLLDAPVPLDVREGRPQWQGMLSLEDGPERIESGWWDGGDITRDYYIAVNPAGEQLWIYRNRRCRHAWYLQGFFG